MTLLVFGKTGQVAAELRRLVPDARFLNRSEADLANPEQCADVIALMAPSMVINAAAYTAVDRAEDEEALATIINGEAPTAMAKACAVLDIPFIQISTDYVFDGTGERAFSPDHPTGPLGAYGRSKLIGENGVCAVGGRFSILRTSWVFSSHGNNFLKTMLRLGGERDKLTIVGDQIGGPTPAGGIAQACLAMAAALKSDAGKAGTYHYSGAPNASWADFAREIFECAGMDVAVEDIATTAYPTPAKRPLNSRLDCASLTSQFGIKRPDWKAATAAIVKDLTS